MTDGAVSDEKLIRLVNRYKRQITDLEIEVAGLEIEVERQAAQIADLLERVQQGEDEQKEA